MSRRPRFSANQTVVFASTLVGLVLGASFPPAALRHAAAQNQAAQNQAPAEPPDVLFAVPFVVPYVPPGNEATAVKLVLRGLRLDNPTEVRVSLASGGVAGGGVASGGVASGGTASGGTASGGTVGGGTVASAKIVSSGVAAVPDKFDPKRVGDRQVEIALTMPGEPPVDGRLELRVVTAAGVSPPYRILVDGGPPAVEEKEPNDGFDKAQAIDLALGTSTKLDGSIHESRNVDVFRFEGRAGERLRGELIAARQGGPLDAFATLFDESGNIVFQADDAEDAAAAGGPVTSPDPRWDTVLPRTGRYYLSLQDVHDRGGVLHRYRLILEKR
jgi:hypothetical protein